VAATEGRVGTSRLRQHRWSALHPRDRGTGRRRAVSCWCPG